MLGLATGGLWGALGAGLVLIAGWAWLRLRQAQDAGQPIRAFRLSTEHAVHVLEIDGRTVVVGTGPGSPPALLASWDSPARRPELRPVDVSPAVATVGAGRHERT